MKRLKRKKLVRRGLAVLLIAALGLAGCSAGSAAGMEEQAAPAAGGLFRKPSNAGAKVSDFLKGGASSKPSSGSAEKPAQTPKPTPEPTPKPSGAVLPSVRSFSGYRMEEQDGGPWYLFHYNADFEKEYVDLVQEYNFTLREKEITSTHSRYIFDYTGPESVGSFEAPQGKFKDKKNIELYIVVLHASAKGAEFHIQYASGITYTETADRSTVTVTGGGGDGGGGSSGGSGSSSGGSSSGGGSGVQVKCSKCSGTGSIACTNCDGKGYKEKVVSTPNYSGKSGSTTSRSRETCYKCHGSGSISCTRCGGSGKQ